MKRLCDFYLRHPRLIGALYCIIPVVLWFVVMTATVPWRGVYLLRLILSVAIGGAIGAFINEFGLRLWLIKHASREGPATVLDGVLIGAGVGIGLTLLPPLTALIATNHPEEAKLFIIACWLLAVVLGGLNGGVLAVIGRKYIERAEP